LHSKIEESMNGMEDDKKEAFSWKMQEALKKITSGEE
jgi:hypothetical protein